MFYVVLCYVNVLTIFRFESIRRDAFSQYLKYLLSPSITKSVKRLLSINEETNGKHTNVFS